MKAKCLSTDSHTATWNDVDMFGMPRHWTVHYLQSVGSNRNGISFNDTIHVKRNCDEFTHKSQSHINQNVPSFGHCCDSLLCINWTLTKWLKWKVPCKVEIKIRFFKPVLKFIYKINVTGLVTQWRNIHTKTRASAIDSLLINYLPLPRVR